MSRRAGLSPEKVTGLALDLPALAGIRLLESAGFAVPFRSDGLTSILHANPAPGLVEEVLGVRLRPLEPRAIDE